MEVGWALFFSIRYMSRMFDSGMGTCPNPGKSEPNLGMFAQTVALFLLQLLK